MRELAASLEDEVLQGALAKQGPADGAAVVQIEKSGTTELGDAEQSKLMEAKVEDASKIASGDSNLSIKQDSDVALTAAPTPSNSNAMELNSVGAADGGGGDSGEQ